MRDMSPVASFAGISLLLSIGCIIGIVILFWLALRRPAVREPACGHCGYHVEGLETMSCPECGSDLRKVGIETPKGRMMHPGVFVIAWTLLLILPFITIFAIAMSVGPRRTVVTATFGLTSSTGAMPQIHIDQRLEGRAVGRGVSVTSATANTVSRDGTTTSTMTFPSIAGSSVQTSTIDIRTAEDAVQFRPSRLTLDRDSAAIAPEQLAVIFGDAPPDAPDDAVELAALINALAQGDPGFTSTRFTIGGRNTVNNVSTVPGWYVPTLIALGAVIYALGVVVYFVIRKRHMAPDRS